MPHSFGFLTTTLRISYSANVKSVMEKGILIPRTNRSTILEERIQEDVVRDNLFQLGRSIYCCDVRIANRSGTSGECGEALG